MAKLLAGQHSAAENWYIAQGSLDQKTAQATWPGCLQDSTVPFYSGTMCGAVGTLEQHS